MCNEFTIVIVVTFKGINVFEALRPAPHIDMIICNEDSQLWDDSLTIFPFFFFFPFLWKPRVLPRGTCSADQTGLRLLHLLCFPGLGLKACATIPGPQHLFHSTEALQGLERFWGWRGGSAIKSTCFSYKGPVLDPYRPYGSSQPSLIKSPRGLNTLFCLLGSCIHIKGK